MAWVAFDRAIKSAEQFELPGPVERWRALRGEIHADICKRGFDAALGSFVQCYGGTTLDASLLLLPCVGFLPPRDPRVAGTVAAIERTLVVDGLVRRYDTEETDDGLPPGEGVFLACSFWLVDAYVMLGRLDDAQRAVRTSAGAAQRRRAARARNTTRRRYGCWETSRRRSRTSRWSTARSTSRAP